MRNLDIRSVNCVQNIGTVPACRVKIMTLARPTLVIHKMTDLMRDGRGSPED